MNPARHAPTARAAMPPATHHPTPALIAALLLLAAPAMGAPGPARLSPAAADSVRAAIDKDRLDTLAWLRTSPSSYLATIHRRDFADRTSLLVGRAGEADVRIDDPAIAPHHLRVTVLGDSFRVEALDPGATFRRGPDTLRTAMVGPSAIGVDRYTLRLSHQRYPAIIVFDPQSPRFRDGAKMDWYPVDLGWRFELPLIPNAAADTTTILSTRGNERRALRVGWFEFEAEGRPCRLEVNRLLEPGVGETNVSVFFRDRTTGAGTYPVGRYIDPVELPGGRYLLDFNNAYNPACAYSDHYNCPIPPGANDLPVAVRAGEKDPHQGH